MNRTLAIRTIQLLARLTELHISSYEMGRGSADVNNMIHCRIIIEDGAALAKELMDLCVTYAESTPDKTAPSRCSGTESSTPTST